MYRFFFFFVQSSFLPDDEAEEEEVLRAVVADSPAGAGNLKEGDEPCGCSLNPDDDDCAWKEGLPVRLALAAPALAPEPVIYWTKSS